jgi:hypothetical protein
MIVLVPEAEAQEFENLVNEFAPGSLAEKPSERHGFDGIDLVMFTFSLTGHPWLFTLMLGYWLGKGKRLIIDDDGIHIMVKSPQRVIEYIRKLIEK